jgi:hypothetical protein
MDTDWETLERMEMRDYRIQELERELAKAAELLGSMEHYDHTKEARDLVLEWYRRGLIGK